MARRGYPQSSVGDRYRCQVGHSFTARTLEASRGHAAERALWNAVIYLEEHARVLEHLARSEAARFEDRATEVGNHEEQVRGVILTTGKPETLKAEAPPSRRAPRRDRKG